MSDAALDLAQQAPIRRPISITATMLAAGRAAFDRERRNLSDLFEFFDEDRDQFLAEIYRSMARAR